jgi:ribosome-binding factor A
MRERISRINKLIKGKIAEILQKEIFIKNVLITVQGVDTSKDLKYTKIKVSIMPFGQSEKALKVLKKNISHLQKRIGEEIRIKFIPKIRFIIDRTEEKANRVEEILRELTN